MTYDEQIIKIFKAVEETEEEQEQARYLFLEDLESE